MPRRLDAGSLVAAAGAVLLLVSLFLDWYGDGDATISGWRVFEAIDLLLAAVALLALSTVAARSGLEPRLPRAPLLVLGMVALAVVFTQLVNDPPAVAGSDAGVESGAWLALAGAALLLAGAIMSAARVSLAIAVEHREPAPPPAPAHEPETVKLPPTEPPA